MVKKIFAFSFVTACLIQSFMFAKLGMADFDVWAKQAEYVQTNNPAQFDFLLAYGHPGGPIIEGVLFFHNVLGFSYDGSLMIFIIIIDGLAIAGASTICYLLSKNNLWWPIVLVILSANDLYLSSTPPSTIASLLISFLSLYSLYIYEKNKLKTGSLIFWGIIAGLIVATRVDIGLVMIFSFLVFLKPKISWRQTFLIFGITNISFVLFDPFMWYMPFQHLKDLIFKIVFHYEYFDTIKMSLSQVLNISALLLVSVFFAVVFLFLKEKIKSPLPTRFIYILLAVTVALYIVFLTAQCQNSRYFLPLINIWQMLLPLFLFSLTSNLKPALSKMADLFFMVILILLPLASLISSVLIDRMYNLIL